MNAKDYWTEASDATRRRILLELGLGPLWSVLYATNDWQGLSKPLQVAIAQQGQ